MTKIRIVSDLHTEAWGHGGIEKNKKWEKLLERCVLPSLDSDKDTILILAGDFGDLSKKPRQEHLLEILSNRFKDIIYVQGNHEYYCGDFVKDQGYYNELISRFDNIHVNYDTIIDGVSFIPATLWTDYNKGDPIDMLACQQLMNDYRWIKYEGNDLTPHHIYEEHKRNLNSIANQLQHNKENGIKTVVVTHHAPSYQSIPAKYKVSHCNPAYYSDLEYLIEEYQPSLWIHGHIHESMDYMIGNTRIIANPYGYHGYETPRKTFKKELILDLI